MRHVTLTLVLQSVLIGLIFGAITSCAVVEVAQRTEMAR